MGYLRNFGLIRIHCNLGSLSHLEKSSDKWFKWIFRLGGQIKIVKEILLTGWDLVSGMPLKCKIFPSTDNYSDRSGRLIPVPYCHCISLDTHPPDYAVMRSTRCLPEADKPAQGRQASIQAILAYDYFYHILLYGNSEF
jgi:hypothetical protein